MLREWRQNIFTRNQYRTNNPVHLTFSLGALSILAFGIASVVSQETSYLTLTATPNSVQKGEPFYITVSVTAHTPVNAVDIVVDIPRDTIRVDGIDTGTSVITLWTEQPYVKDGKVHLRGGTFRRGFVGTHTIARIRATALATGSTQVTTTNATFIAGDGRGTEVPVARLDQGRLVLNINERGTIVAKASVAIVTDIDGDGVVDLKDVSMFMSAWFSKRNTFDFDSDGKMTFRDFSILLYDTFTR